MKKLCIVGAGGFAKEIASYLFEDSIKGNFVLDAFLDVCERDDLMGIKVRPMSYFDPCIHLACIAVGNSFTRNKIANELPANTEYAKIINKNSHIGNKVFFGKGAIVCPFSVATVDVGFGDFAILNYNVTIGHDTITGNCFTASPGVNVSGKCKIGNNVYFGANTSTREKISICDNVVIGANACIIEDICIDGTYVGVPAKRISGVKSIA